MAPSGYPVPASEARAQLRFKNSVFSGFAARADSVAGARTFIDDIRARFPDASHCVYAFAIGHGASVTHGMSDDREPAGTAGRPLLAVVQGSGLGDVVLTIVRYFGGTKLGTGGLVRAYTSTAQATLAEVEVVEKVTFLGVSLRAMPYEYYEAVKSAVTAVAGTVESEEFADAVTMTARVPEDQVPELARVVREASSGRLELEVTDDGGRGDDRASGE